MDIDGEGAFDKVLDRLIDTAADMRLGQEKINDQSHKLYVAEEQIKRMDRESREAAWHMRSRIARLEAALTKAGVELPKEPTEETEIPF